MPSRESAPTTAGRTYETCVRCARRGLSLSHPAFEWEPKYEAGGETYPAGSACCRAHEPVPAARASHWQVTAELSERLGPHDRAGFPGGAARQALHAVAADAPRSCPVCAACGHSRENLYAEEDGDFSATYYLQFARGTAMVATCWDCGHTVELAALSPGGPHVGTVTCAVQETLWDPPRWAVTIRAHSPKQGAGQVDLYWAGPVHGRGPLAIPNTWAGTDPGDPRVMRFTSPAAAQAALDSVFAPGSRWQLPHAGTQVRIVAVPERPARPAAAGQRRARRPAPAAGRRPGSA
jgi:hypothetical protein